jgi:maltose O-acetyltransferase
VIIGDGAWLGGGVIVCPGVRIGEETVVGAGSVVTRDLPARVLAVGNPARVVREL